MVDQAILPIPLAIDQIVSQYGEPQERLDLLYLDLSDRIKQHPAQCTQAVRHLVANLRVDNSVRVHSTVQILDSLGKNTTRSFHLQLHSRKHADAFLLALRRCRNKLSLKNKLEKKDVKARWEKSDQQLLGLIQLWADTFIMQQGDFLGLFMVYKQLCLEKVKWPMRDPNMRVLMEGICNDSPMYEHVESLANREVRMPLQAKEAPVVEAPAPRRDSFDLDPEPGDDFQIDLSNYNMIETTTQILADMATQAQTLEELKNEIAMEMFQSCTLIVKQLKKTCR